MKMGKWGRLVYNLTNSEVTILYKKIGLFDRKHFDRINFDKRQFDKYIEARKMSHVENYLVKKGQE
jgi:hypothetical protein